MRKIGERKGELTLALWEKLLAKRSSKIVEKSPQ
jgi:hypothetical protein